MFEKHYTLRKNLVNAMCKIREGKLNVGYFGGSITCGGNASDFNTTSYRALTTRHLRERYPECEVNELAAAVGGTGSDYGAYRIERDLFSKGTPDICFIEYPVNDHYEHINTPEYITEHYESIFLKLLEKNPYCDIVVILTNERRTMNRPDYYSKVTHDKIAAHYGFSTVRIGDALGEVIGDVSNDESFFKFFSDPYHPTDAGHKIYADALCEFLDTALVDGEYTKHELPTALSPVLHLDTSIINASDLKLFGDWTVSGTSIRSRVPNSKFECEFDGDEVAIQVYFSNNAGVIAYEIDGKSYGYIDLWYGYGYSTKHTLAKKLGKGKHTLVLWVSDRENKADNGEVNISAVLIG